MKTFIAISGSLRKDSFNTKLLNTLKGLAPEDVSIEVVDISAIPMYDQDKETSFPQTAQDLKNKIRLADGVIFATPEYNRSIPGVLKNTIDWVSRPYGDNAFDGKKVLVLGASIGPISTALAQYHLKQIMLYLNTHVVGQPEFFMGPVGDKFDAEGNLVDESTRQHLKDALLALVRA
jgi:chromate reductase